MTAKYAESVFEGKNLTPKPPRTDIWGLLYVQVLQADGKSYRNILIGEKQFYKPGRGNIVNQEPNLYANMKRKVEPGKIKLQADAALIEPIPIGNLEMQSSDMPPYGQTWWDLKSIYAILRGWGLPADSPLSVLAVELMPPYDNQDFGHYSDQPPLNLGSLGSFTEVSQAFGAVKPVFKGMAFYESSLPPSPDHFPNPLSTDLGKVRILRTSPLTPVPKVCAPS